MACICTQTTMGTDAQPCLKTGPHSGFKEVHYFFWVYRFAHGQTPLNNNIIKKGKIRYMEYPLRPNSIPEAPLEKKNRIKWESLVKGITMSINSPESM